MNISLIYQFIADCKTAEENFRTLQKLTEQLHHRDVTVLADGAQFEKKNQKVITLVYIVFKAFESFRDCEWEIKTKFFWSVNRCWKITCIQFQLLDGAKKKKKNCFFRVYKIDLVKTKHFIGNQNT